MVYLFLGQTVNQLLHGKSGADDLRLDLISDAHKILPIFCDENSEAGLRFRKPASLCGEIFYFPEIRWKSGGRCPLRKRGVSTFRNRVTSQETMQTHAHP